MPPICRTTSSSGAPGVAQTVPLDCLDHNGDATTILIDKGPASGTLGAVNQGAKTVTYTPGGGFAGSDSFDIRALAGGNLSSVATVVMGVQTATGPQGPQGTQGPQGPQGPPGRDATVSCKAKGKKIKCTVAFAAASGVRRALLSKNGVTYAEGKPKARGDQLLLRFRSSRGLAPGRYVLTVVQHVNGNRVVTKSSVKVR